MSEKINKQKGNQFYLETSSKTDKWQYVIMITCHKNNVIEKERKPSTHSRVKRKKKEVGIPRRAHTRSPPAHTHTHTHTHTPTHRRARSWWEWVSKRGVHLSHSEARSHSAQLSRASRTVKLTVAMQDHRREVAFVWISIALQVKGDSLSYETQKLWCLGCALKLLHECLLISPGFHYHCEGRRCVLSNSGHSDGCLLYPAFGIYGGSMESCAFMCAFWNLIWGCACLFLRFAH